MDCIGWVVGSLLAQTHAISQLQLEGDPCIREHDGGRIHFTFGTIGRHHVTLAYSEMDHVYATTSFMHTHFGHQTFKMFILGGAECTSHFPLHNLSFGDCLVDAPAIDEAKFIMKEGTGDIPRACCASANRLLHAVDRFLVETQGVIRLQNRGNNHVFNALPLYKHWEPAEWESLLCSGLQIDYKLPCLVVRGVHGSVPRNGDARNSVPWDIACQAAAETTKGIIEWLE